MESQNLDKCPGINQMVDYLHSITERNRARVARELHDELGGLLVSVVMDIAFAEQNSQLDDELRQRLDRVRRTMAEAIDLKRRIIEDLRPSLLDNFGLVEALRWEIRQAELRSRIPCSETYPEMELAFTKEASIGVFRIVQDSLRLALDRRSTGAVQIALRVADDNLHITIATDSEAPANRSAGAEEHLAICSIRHRVHSLGGHMVVVNGDATYNAVLPLARLTQAPDTPVAA
jgi:signal transduction histidine kinase